MHQEQLIPFIQSSIEKHRALLNASRYPLMQTPSFSMDQRGSIAASAILQKNHLRFNKKLLQANVTYFDRQVVPHELAHLAVFEHFGKVKPHGKEWQFIMSDILQTQPVRCHSLDLSVLRRNEFIYRCKCSEVKLSIRRHNNVQKGKTRYLCKDCKQPLVFVEKSKLIND